MRPGVLWRLIALPLLGMLLSFVPLFLWVLPWAEVRYPGNRFTMDLALFLPFFFALIVGGIVIGIWTGWRVNEWVCRYALGWSADQVRHVFREGSLPPDWLKHGVLGIDATDGAARAAEAHMRVGLVVYVLKVGVMRWGLTMFIALALAPALLKDAPLQPRELFVKALIWLAGGVAFGLAMWFVQRRTARKLQASLGTS